MSGLDSERMNSDSLHPALSFRSHDWRPVYRTGDQDLLNDFYVPALSRAIKYDRAVGYFSSKVLTSSLRGLAPFLESNGKIRLVIGHPLTPEEFEEIRREHGGFNPQQKIMELIDSLTALDKENRSSHDHAATLLGCLVRSGHMDIRFAFRLNGMYHEKIGILKDAVDDSLVFCGSANETVYGLDAGYNAESLTVYKSWEQQTFASYATDFMNGFERLWAGEQPNTKTIQLDSEVYQKLAQLAKGVRPCDLIDFERDVIAREELFFIGGPRAALPEIPAQLNGQDFEIKQHQLHAIEDWQANDFRGILQLSTGSGKTITAIYASTKIAQARAQQGQSTVLVVAVPYIELAEQWAKVLANFGIYPFRIWGSHSDWSAKLSAEIAIHQLSPRPHFLCALVVNASLAKDPFQQQIKKLPEAEVIFIGDECHNHGASNISQKLPNARYKLGLSATPFRSEKDELEQQFPDESRERIKAYYGAVIAEYGLGQAIHDGVLCPYQYRLVPSVLSLEEQEVYDDLSREIGKIMAMSSGVRPSPDQQHRLTMLAGQRSRLLGSIESKTLALENLVRSIPLQNRKKTLIYCGEGRAVDEDGELDEERTIEKFSKVLKGADWKTTRFTSRESSAQREVIMRSFRDGDIDALVSMKVLDEGVDVPDCHTAIITASTRNPRQFIQRRGRVLRKAEGKQRAIIYDFVTLPNVSAEPSYAKALVAAELARVDDFCTFAENRLEVETQIKEIGMSDEN